MKDKYKTQLDTQNSKSAKDLNYYSISKAAKDLSIDLAALPFSLRVLFENLLRNIDGKNIKFKDLEVFKKWLDKKGNLKKEILFKPARVLMQDFTGVPAVVDLAAMRDAVKDLGGDATKVNPLSPVDLVIDHSVQVDYYANKKAFKKNVKLEMERNKERYELLRSAQVMFDNFKTVPPGTGICHQVNLEYLAEVVFKHKDPQTNEILLYPDTVVGTDSHTTMVNGLAVLGWGVGGIEAESAMLGQPISMNIPEVIGFEITGKAQDGVTATDIVLTITQELRKKNVVGKFVEFYGAGLKSMSLADRATIANMAPEYGATCGFFPIDNETIKYLKLTARDKKQIELVEEYARKQKLWASNSSSACKKLVFTDSLTLDLNNVMPSVAGPKRPQDKVTVCKVTEEFNKVFKADTKREDKKTVAIDKKNNLSDGDLVIAAITSCTNTSNPSVMLAAGLVAKKAYELGIKVKPWVKTSLAPGSQVVEEYYKKSGLNKYLDKLGFNIVGFGCTTCIGNSGPLNEDISKAITDNDLYVGSVLSGNRNFEGRVHALVKANYLASPPLVVAYALAGSLNIDISKEPIAYTKKNKPVFLKDIWPSNKEVQELVEKIVTPKMFKEKYKDVFKGDKAWQKIKVTGGSTYDWPKNSTYIKKPPYFDGLTKTPAKLQDIKNANILALLGDSITTDHISPAGSIAKNSPAAKFLEKNKVKPQDFNSYGSRRGNDDVMTRGTFANVRIRNEMAPGTEGGFTNYIPNNEITSIYDAAQKYKANNKDLVVVAGKDYGMGSSRDWAAKGTLLLGVKAVITESFERIHRSNLIGMGVLPLNFKKGETRKTYKLTGKEEISILDIEKIKPGSSVKAIIHYNKRKKQEITLKCAINTASELEYYKNGGILNKIVREF